MPKTGKNRMQIALNYTFNRIEVFGHYMESQSKKTPAKAPPEVTFERALERVRSQIAIRNDIMRASFETAQRLQEGRGNFMLYSF